MWKIIYFLLIIGCLYALNRYFDSQDVKSVQEKQVCELVTKIIAENYSSSIVKCEKVELSSNLLSGFNRGEAYLTNGKIIPVGINVEGQGMNVVISP